MIDEILGRILEGHRSLLMSQKEKLRVLRNLHAQAKKDEEVPEAVVEGLAKVKEMEGETHKETENLVEELEVMIE